MPIDPVVSGPVIDAIAAVGLLIDPARFFRVLNVVPDKAAALAEMYRVLRPGGRLQAADIVLERPVSENSKQDVTLWTGCIAGGLLAGELRALIGAAGFSTVDVAPGEDVFAGAPQASNAAAYGTRGAGIRASR